MVVFVFEAINPLMSVVIGEVLLVGFLTRELLTHEKDPNEVLLVGFCTRLFCDNLALSVAALGSRR